MGIHASQGSLVFVFFAIVMYDKETKTYRPIDNAIVTIKIKKNIVNKYPISIVAVSLEISELEFVINVVLLITSPVNGPKSML